MFIKLLMVRGSFSASFPVIAVMFSPTFIQDNSRRYPGGYKKEGKNFGADQKKKKKKKKEKKYKMPARR